jgi:hypothetical protein
LHLDGRRAVVQPQPVRLPGRQFSFTKPASSQTLSLPAGKTKVTVPVPDELLKRNRLVEVSALGNTQVAPGDWPTGV